MYLLTAGHVVLAANARRNDPILEPGHMAGGTDPVCRLGQLDDWTPYRPDAPNFADVALVRVENPSVVDAAITSIGRPLGISTSLRVGAVVQLHGQRSGYRRGIIADLAYEAVVPFVIPGIGEREILFRNLVLCTRFTEGGDSGAAVLNMDRELVGIHMGGTDSASFFSPIGEITGRWPITVDV